MANEIRDAANGLKRRLEAISGLRVLDHVPGSWNDFPLAVIRLERRSVSQFGLAGSSFEGEFVVSVIASRSTGAGAYANLDPFIDPLGASSIQAAIDGDNTLGGAVDDARLVEVTRMGDRKIGSAMHVGADFRVRFARHLIA